MEQFLDSLTKAVQGAPLIAAGAALLWGVLSIVISPCHLASIPLVVGFMGQRENRTRRSDFAVALFFALGVLVTIEAIGIAIAYAGASLPDAVWMTYFMAGILLLVGLYFLGVLALPWSGPGQMGFKGKGNMAALVMGLIFGVGVGPCTFAFMAPILGLVYENAKTDRGFGILLILLFGLAHCAVIVVAGLSTGAVQRCLNWNESSRGAVWFKKVCGILVILGGLYLIYTA